jgi:SagB-type dehydrogenase family enzyme
MDPFIPRTHSLIRRARVTRRGATLRPDEVPQGLHKEYERMPKIQLPNPQPLGVELGHVLGARRSLNECLGHKGLTLAEMGTLLGHSFGKRGKGPSRNYPSGGALFPNEIYLLGNVLEDRPSGVFHYHPSAHALEHLWDLPEGFSTSDIIRSPSAPVSSTLFIFTSVWGRSTPKYGDFAYYLGMLEAGHMGQNLLLVSAAMDFSARPVGGFDDETAAQLLDLDPNREQPVYSIVFCRGLK